MSKFFLCIALAFCCKGVLAQYKCISNGLVSYQDLPCIGSGGQIDLRPASGNSAQVSNAPKRVGISDVDLNEALARGVPMIGMTREQLDSVMRQPSFVNPSNYKGVLHDQIGYNRGRDVWYVYTRNGIVTDIQFRVGGGSNVGSNQAVSCPTSAEIRDAITSASSITLGEAEKVARWKVIQEMQSCGKLRK